MQSKQKICSQFWGVPTSWVVNRMRQIEHLSELPSELSDAKPDVVLLGTDAGLGAEGVLDAEVDLEADLGASEWSVAHPEVSLSSSESLKGGSVDLRVRGTELSLLPSVSKSLTT